MTKPRFRVTPAFVAALAHAQQQRSQAAIGEPFGISQSSLSRHANGELLDEHWHAPFVALGVSLGLAAEACLIRVPATAGESFEAFNARFCVVFAREQGRAYVLDEATNTRISYAEFKRAYGEAGERWLFSTEPAPRGFSSFDAYLRVSAPRGQR